MTEESTETTPLYEKIPLLVVVGIVKAVVWVIDKGPFFPPFGGSRRRVEVSLEVDEDD